MPSVQSLSRVPRFATPWAAAHQASLSITNSQSLLKLMSIESVMPSNHLILCHPLLLLPSILPSIRIFSNESALRIRWQKYRSFSISPSSEYSGLISFRIMPQKNIIPLKVNYFVFKFEFPYMSWLNKRISNSLQYLRICNNTSFPPHFPVNYNITFPK